MSMTSSSVSISSSAWNTSFWGLFWLALATLAAAVFFMDGLGALLQAWQLPEYSHGPLIPVLSALLFLRQLKEYPPEPGPKRDRWAGVAVILGAIAFGSLGKLAGIADVVAYATIIWVYGILLVSFGWKTGWHFWPPVLHLVYMLPLPDTLYYKLSTWLQFVSSELGVWFLKLMSVPVFLDGNIIDLGVYKLHVAEACSGLRYLFPIMSFSYIFAVLYRGPMWHKAVLLISAAPIAVVMNSVRIAVAGYIVNHYGIEWVDGFTHFFEGWVIFISCILILFALARIMLFLHPVKMSLTEALDLETEGLAREAARIRLVQPSTAMIAAAAAMMIAVVTWETMPARATVTDIERESFALFPQRLGEWQQVGLPERLEPQVARALAADDYHSIALARDAATPAVGLFMAWYADQSSGGVHSPEVCLPGGGWEIASIKRVDITEEIGTAQPFNMNEVVIQKGTQRTLVFYWFEQNGRRIAWDLMAKLMLFIDGVSTRQTDGALVRLTTVIQPNESDAAARERLMSVVHEMIAPLPRFVPAR